MQFNVSYRVEDHNENFYEPPPENLPNEKFAVKNSEKKTSAIIAISALILALLALLVAIVVLYFGAQWMQHTNSSTSNEENLQSISLMQQEITTLQNQLERSATFSVSDDDFLTMITELQQKTETLQTQVNQKLSIANFLDTLTLGNPVSSCSALPEDSPSGNYWILTSNSSIPVAHVYCDMERTSCSCSTERGWMRVANLNMTDSSQQCPQGFTLVNRTTPPLRTCGRIEPAGCWSTTFQTHNVEYSRVCGQIRAYQDGTPDAFSTYQRNPTFITIDDNYVDGFSLTYGQSPRKHIWTFAATIDEYPRLESYDTCPCTHSFKDSPLMDPVPPFVGEDYFCDTGSRDEWQQIFYPDDPLWDGQGCGGTSTCCEFNNPPWFCKQLPQPATDDIELRICGSMRLPDEDTPFELVEIYVQ